MYDTFGKLIALLPAKQRIRARAAARALVYAPYELADLMTGSNQGLPPRRLRLVGDGDFLAVGEGVRDHLVEAGGLRPGDHVLDIGCGVGRIALPLTGYMSEQSRYLGFDIMKDCVRWCSRRITPGNANFVFRHSDILNEHYNPEGKVAASEYAFPADDNSFDFTFATSVFTHMLWPDTCHYLEEVSRVLKPGGKAYLTFFLLNGERAAKMEAGATDRTFRHKAGNGWASHKRNPEAAIAFREDDVLAAAEGLSLDLRCEPLYGSWAGDADAASYQDVLLFRKAG